MRLFHGSNIEIDKIDLSKCRPNKDFGCGFYLTTIKSQAEKMARRVARIYGGTPCVIEFEFNEAAIIDLDLNVRCFTKPSKEWALFVINNRKRGKALTINDDCNIDCRYDLVIGPIANDDLALLFRQFDYGLIEVNTLVKEMEYKQLTDQYSFHTEKSLAALKKVGAYDE